MGYDKLIFHELLIDSHNSQEYMPLLSYHGFGKGDIEQFDVCFLMYGREILDSFFVQKDGINQKQSAIKISNIFRHVSIENIWDAAFCLSVYQLIDLGLDGEIDTVQKLFDRIEERKIRESQYSIFAKESHGVFLWQFQLTNFLQLFFESYQVASHFTKSFNTKRATELDRINEITLPNNENLGYYIWNHSVGNFFDRPNLITAHRIWNVISKGSYVSHDIEEILSQRD